MFLSFSSIRTYSTEDFDYLWKKLSVFFENPFIFVLGDVADIIGIPSSNSEDIVSWCTDFLWTFDLSSDEKVGFLKCEICVKDLISLRSFDLLPDSFLLDLR